MSTLGQEKEAAEFSQFDKNLQRRELHEKWVQLKAWRGQFEWL